ncbi:MAG TPA: potassium transporter TrkG, partial [Bacteroidales bacterium]|nr:potassium transporter TrkG [Bacteroidales bacterium]
MLISLGVSIWYDVDDGAFALLYSFLITSLFGLMPLIFVPNTNEISIKEGLFIVAGSWVMSCLIGVLPYVMWGGEISFADAWFESVSGYTTTGATILKDIEALPRSILFWRASTHWIGGIGIVIFVMVMLPSMGNAKSILFRSELAPLAKDNLKYRAREAMRILLWVYLGLTFLEVILLMIFGLDWFDA